MLHEHAVADHDAGQELIVRVVDERAEGEGHRVSSSNVTSTCTISYGPRQLPAPGCPNVVWPPVIDLNAPAIAPLYAWSRIGLAPSTGSISPVSSCCPPSPSFTVTR